MQVFGVQGLQNAAYSVRGFELVGLRVYGQSLRFGLGELQFLFHVSGFRVLNGRPKPRDPLSLRLPKP